MRLRQTFILVFILLYATTCYAFKITRIHFDVLLNEIVVEVDKYGGRYSPTFDPAEITNKEVLIEKLKERFIIIDAIEKAGPLPTIDTTPSNLNIIKELENEEVKQ